MLHPWVLPPHPRHPSLKGILGFQKEINRKAGKRHGGLNLTFRMRVWSKLLCNKCICKLPSYIIYHRTYIHIYISIHIVCIHRHYIFRTGGLSFWNFDDHGGGFLLSPRQMKPEEDLPSDTLKAGGRGTLKNNRSRFGCVHFGPPPNWLRFCSLGFPIKPTNKGYGASQKQKQRAASFEGLKRESSNALTLSWVRPFLSRALKSYMPTWVGVCFY